MIVVVAFMKGFQQKFREDIVDAQGHARAIPLGRTREWQGLQAELMEKPEVFAVSPYLQGPVLVQKSDNQSIPLAIGLDLTIGPAVLPLDEFLGNGQLRMQAHDAFDVTLLDQVLADARFGIASEQHAMRQDHRHGPSFI